MLFFVLQGLEKQKISDATFGFVGTMLGAAFHLFALSVQIPMYETNGKKNNGNLRMLNVTGNETLTAPIYEENPTSTYLHVHIVNNPIPISSNKTDSQGNYPKMFHSSSPEFNC